MKTGAEAIRALATQLPAFRQKLNDGWYQVRIAGRDAGETELSARLNEPLANGAVIHIVPRLAGAKSGGVFQVVLGAALIAVAWWNPVGWLGAAAVSGMYAAGASMILGGVAQMLAPKARTSTAASTDNGKQNTYFSSLDISGNVNANSGTLNNVTINENCQIKGKLSANQIEGDIVKTVSKSFPRTNSYASGTITVRISDDQKFDRQVMIPPVLFRGGKHENFNSNNQQSYWYSTCRLRVTRNGQEIFNQSTTDAQGVFSSVIDMPAGQGTLTLTFTVSSSGANNWTPTTSISDLLVVVMKKSTAGISIS